MPPAELVTPPLAFIKKPTTSGYPKRTDYITGNNLHRVWSMAETLTELFNEQTEAYGEKPALRRRVGDEWQLTTWSEYGRLVRDLAVALNGRGVGHLSSVAILSGNIPAYFVTDMATVAVGGRVASIYETSSPQQILYVLQNSGARMIFCQNASFVEKVEEIRSELSDLLIVSFDDDSGDATYEQLLHEGKRLNELKPGLYEELNSVIQPEDAACIIYTSGTTGPPKGALISHRSILTILSTLAEYMDKYEGGRGNTRVLSYLPLAHIAERSFSLYPMMISGGDTWCSSVDTIKTDLPQCHPQRMLGVPRVWEKFEEALRVYVPDPTVLDDEAKSGLLAMIGLDQLITAVSGAAPIGIETLKYFDALGIQILEAYGLTETTGLATGNAPDERKLGTVGKAVPEIEVKIADDGEVLIRGANFTEYLKNPEATSEALDDEGWMHSGDLGSLDDEGYLTIVGRKKDLLITAGGENVSPANIQLLLCESPYISQALVIGDRRKFISALITLSEEVLLPWAEANGLGGKPMAELAKEPRVIELVDEAVTKANSQLARVQQVRKYEILQRDFSLEADELTPTMKLKRRVIEKDYADLIDSIYAS